MEAGCQVSDTMSSPYRNKELTLIAAISNLSDCDRRTDFDRAISKDDLGLPRDCGGGSNRSI